MKYTTISNGNVIKSEPTFSTAAKRSRKSSERKTVESSSDEMNSGADNSMDTSTGTFQYLVFALIYKVTASPFLAVAVWIRDLENSILRH